MKRRSKISSINRARIGLPPGSGGFFGEAPDRPVEMTLFSYDEKHLEEKKIDSLEDFRSARENGRVCWLNVDGLHDQSIMDVLKDEFFIHPLVLEDIRNVNHRPKVEYMEGYNFIILKMFYHHPQSGELVSEQVSLILGPNYVISFQERKEDVFDTLRERLRTGKGKIRSQGADYLAYCLADAITDNYFLLLEQMEVQVEELEDELTLAPSEATLAAIHELKRSLIRIRHAVWPQREVVSSLGKDENPLLSPSLVPYLRDLYDHTIQVMDTIDGFRDLVSGMIDLYMSSVSNRMNEVMKVLTIISTIFIPLSFVAGVYGMNFDPQASPFNMPELSWRHGYFFALGLMAVMVGGMLIFFRRKKWI